MTQPLDPSRCPLCGQPNQCGQCDPARIEQSCWCFAIDITPQIQKEIPAPARDKACLCPRCARGEMPETS